MKIRNRPIEREAIHYDGTNQPEVYRWVERITGCADRRDYIAFVGGKMYVHTREGDMKANPGDYLIYDGHGGIYPCKPDVFETAYEVIEK